MICLTGKKNHNDGVVTFDVCVLARKVTSLINIIGSGNFTWWLVVARIGQGRQEDVFAHPLSLSAES